MGASFLHLTQRAIAPVLKYATNVSSRTLELLMLVNSFRRAAELKVLVLAQRDDTLLSPRTLVLVLWHAALTPNNSK